MDGEAAHKWVRPTVSRSRLDLDDIQGLFARGYGDLPSAAYVLVSMGAGARAAPQSGENGASSGWLGSLAAAVTSARGRPGREAVNVAFTAGGLSKLGLGPEAVGRFSAEFSGGMVAPHRSRVLGDIDECAPEGWAWGGPGTEPVDALLLLYAPDDAALATLRRAQGERLAEHGLREVRTLDTADLDGIEHFGFRDSISQPIVEGLSKAGRAGRTRHGRGGRVRARLSQRVQPLHGPARAVPRRRPCPASSRPTRRVREEPTSAATAATWCSGSCPRTRRILGVRRGGSGPPGGAGDPEASTRLAAKMVGRWPGGAPLVLAPDADDPSLVSADDFRFDDQDPNGLRCPIGAHIRRTNPRDALDPRPGSSESLAVNKRHRLLRRGRTYGDRIVDELTPDAVLAKGDDAQARDPLHLPERQHRAAVRVCAGELGEQSAIRGPLR